MIEKNMPSLHRKFKGQTLFHETCRVADGSFLPHIAPEESQQVLMPCVPEVEGSITCRNPDLATYFREVDGLDFGTVIGKPLLTTIPKFIPILDRAAFGIPAAAISQEIVGVSLEDIFYSAPRNFHGRIQVGSQLRIREDVLRSPVFKNKKVIIFNSGRDALIEKIWQDFHELDLPKKLSAMGVAVVTGINFSVFLGNCPVGQVFNMKKSLKSVDYFQEAGIESIPHIYFTRSQDLNKWIDWLRANPAVKMVAINCQFTRDTEVAEMAAEGIKFITENLGREISFLLEGPSQELLSLIHEYGCSGQVLVAIKGPSMDAVLFGKSYSVENGRLIKTQIENAPKIALLRRNILVYERYVFDVIFGRSGTNLNFSRRAHTSAANQSRVP